MTHQLDMMPAELVTQAVLDRIDAQLPKVREVKSRLLPEMFHDEQSDAQSTARLDNGGSNV